MAYPLHSKPGGAMQDQADSDKGGVLVLVVESAPDIRALQQSLLGGRYALHCACDGEFIGPRGVEIELDDPPPGADG